jgi:hypothetical protein
MNIWQFQNLISKRLLQWGLGSVLIGFLLRFGGKFWKNLGNQFIAWGAIDAAIAVRGQIDSNERIDQYENPASPTVKAQEASKLSRLLWMMTALDVFYILFGFWWSKRDKGTGIGVLIQGAFLLFFDSFHALKVPKNHED